MRILIGNYELFNGPSQNWSLSNLRAPFSRELEEVQPIRAAEITTIPRGLARTEITFTMQKGMADLLSAISKVLLWQAEIPTSGLIRFEMPRNSDGTGGLDNWYLDGGVTAGAPTHIGVLVTMDVTIVGGVFRRTPTKP